MYETCKTEHSNSRLCIGLQLQAQKLLTITAKFRWVLRVRVILNWGLYIRHGVEHSWHQCFFCSTFTNVFLLLSRCLRFLKVFIYFLKGFLHLRFQDQAKLLQSSFTDRHTMIYYLTLRKLENYVGPVPTYCAAVHLTVWAENRHPGYSCPGERSHQFRFFHAFSFLRATAVLAGTAESAY